MRARILLAVASILCIAPAAYSDLEIGELDFQNPQGSVVVPEAEVMRASLNPMYGAEFGRGRMVHHAWHDTNGVYRRNLRIDVVVPVPNSLPGFGSLDDAMDADVHVEFSHHGVVYTECMLALEPVVSKSAVHFTVKLETHNDQIKPYRGICDVNVLEDGIQAGIPSLGHGVYITTHIDGDVADDIMFLEGWCE